MGEDKSWFHVRLSATSHQSGTPETPWLSGLYIASLVMAIESAKYFEGRNLFLE